MSSPGPRKGRQNLGLSLYPTETEGTERICTWEPHRVLLVFNLPFSLIVLNISKAMVEGDDSSGHFLQKWGIVLLQFGE